jgi:hypothetical protein
MVSAPSPPPPPDPYKTAEYQSELNRNAAISQQGLNMVNQVTPYGTLTYAPDPKAYLGHGATTFPGMYTAYTQLSPRMQKLFNINAQNAMQSGEIAQQLQKNVMAAANRARLNNKHVPSYAGGKTTKLWSFPYGRAPYSRGESCDR